jgi:hypothetical protein
MFNAQIAPLTDEQKVKRVRTETSDAQNIEKTLQLCCITMMRLAGEARCKYSSDKDADGESLIQALNSTNDDIAKQSPAKGALMFSDEAIKNAKRLARAHKDAMQVMELAGSFLDNLSSLGMLGEEGVATVTSKPSIMRI